MGLEQSPGGRESSFPAKLCLPSSTVEIPSVKFYGQKIIKIPRTITNCSLLIPLHFNCKSPFLHPPYVTPVATYSDFPPDPSIYQLHSSQGRNRRVQGSESRRCKLLLTLTIYLFHHGIANNRHTLYSSLLLGIYFSSRFSQHFPAKNHKSHGHKDQEATE